jgi:hypothetical protein
MMDPLVLTSLLQMAGQVGYGAYQGIKANKLLKQLGKQPEYTYDYAKRSVAGLGNLAQGEMPGLTQQLQGVNQSMANTTQSIANMAPSGAAALGALVQAGAGTQQATADILGNAAQTKLGLQQNYLTGLGGLQEYANKAYQINQLEPYQMKLNQIYGLKAAGAENIGTGIKSGVEAAGTQAMLKSLGTSDTGISNGMSLDSKQQMINAAWQKRDTKRLEYLKSLWNDPELKWGE